MDCCQRGIHLPRYQQSQDNRIKSATIRYHSPPHKQQQPLNKPSINLANTINQGKTRNRSIIPLVKQIKAKEKFIRMNKTKRVSETSSPSSPHPHQHLTQTINKRQDQDKYSSTPSSPTSSPSSTPPQPYPAHPPTDSHTPSSPTSRPPGSSDVSRSPSRRVSLPGLLAHPDASGSPEAVSDGRMRLPMRPASSAHGFVREWHCAVPGDWLCVLGVRCTGRRW